MEKSQIELMSRQDVEKKIFGIINKYINGDSSKIEHLAKALGVSKRMIYAYWSGEKMPSLKTYYLLLHVVNS